MISRILVLTQSSPTEGGSASEIRMFNTDDSFLDFINSQIDSPDVEKFTRVDYAFQRYSYLFSNKIVSYTFVRDDYIAISRFNEDGEIIVEQYKNDRDTTVLFQPTSNIFMAYVANSEGEIEPYNVSRRQNR